MIGKWWLWLSAAILVVVVVVAGVLITDVGTPQDPISVTPEPCDLLSDATVQALVGKAKGHRSEPSGTPRWRPLHRAEDQLRCEWSADPEDILAGQVTVDVDRYYSNQFGLGPTGSTRAAEFFKEWRRFCTKELAVEHGHACVKSMKPLDLTVHLDNVVVRLWFTRIGGNAGGTATPTLDDRAQQLGDEISSSLEQSRTAGL